MFNVLMALVLTVPHGDPDVVVVCPAPFQESLRPWVEYRATQGHRIALVRGGRSSWEIRKDIRKLGKSGNLRFVLLVGDAEPALRVDPAILSRCVPVHWSKPTVNVDWGSEPHIGTDNWYADLDDDKLPDVALGRLTADTPDELRRIVKKILSYERSNDFGHWRRQMNFVAGLGGFGVLGDLIIESTAKYFLTREIPADMNVSMTYASWRSPYCPDPRRFRFTTIGRLNEGCLFWVYLGHGFHMGLDEVRVPKSSYPILSNADIPRLECVHGSPIALFLSCYSGAFDAIDDCMAEEMLRAPGGPVAILAGSRMTMPYGMAVLGIELSDAIFERQSPTLGEAILLAKRNMVKADPVGGTSRLMLDKLATTVSPKPRKLADERAEHVLLFNLIGDPLLRIRHPKSIRLDVPETAKAGESFVVRGSSAVSGRAMVELVVSRGCLTFDASPRFLYPHQSEKLVTFQQIYERANDTRLTSVGVPIVNGRFATRLTIPSSASGICHVRVYVEGSSDFARGSATITIGEHRATRVDIARQREDSPDSR